MLLLFIISPLAVIIVYSIILCNAKSISKKQIWSLATFLSIYLGLLNSTKELSGDFSAYHMDFINVPQSDYISYLLDFGKEPLYTTFTYISYYLFDGNWAIFVTVLTAINYILISYSLINISEHLNINYKKTIIALFFMAFFFQGFAAVGNIMRQAPAQALTLVFLTRIYLEKRYSWWIAICALFTHTSCLPILAIGIIPSMSRKFTIKSFLLISIVLSGMVFVFFSMENILSNIPFIGYIYEKTSNIDAIFGTDAWQTQHGFNKATFILVLILSIMAISIYIKNISKKNIQWIGIININIILIIMLCLCDIMQANYLFMRYYFYIYTFQNVLLLCYIHQNRFINNNLVTPIIQLCLLIYFFYEYTHNIFNYSSILEAITYPVPFYFL